MAERFDFEALQKTWQGSDPSVDLPSLESMIRTRSWWLYALTAMDALGTLVIAGFLLWLLSGEPGLLEYLFVGFLAAVCVFMWWLVLRIRRGTWRLDAASPAAMLDLLIRRCRASVRLAKLNLWAMGVGVAFGFAVRFFLRPRLELPRLSMEEPEKMVFRGVVAVAATLWVVGAEWHRRRKQRELERLEALRAEWEQESREPPAGA